jgi:hypothetical protein
VKETTWKTGVGGRMGSEWILGRLAGGCGVDSAGLGYRPVAGCSEYGDESSGSSASELVITKKILTRFKKTIPLYSENHMKPINIPHRQKSELLLTRWYV